MRLILARELFQLAQGCPVAPSVSPMRDDQGMSDVFVLGAGFSKAINAAMPVLAGLGNRVIKDLGDQRLDAGKDLAVDNLEDWLSYLAQDQPWLSEAENLLNRATFLRVTPLLRRAIGEAETTTRAEPPPPWLKQLVARWHRDRSTVLTLNYDTLVEAAYIDTVTIRSHLNPNDAQNYAAQSQLYPIAVTPAHARRGGALASVRAKTFSLLKLHGSLSWQYSGRSTFWGETIYDAGIGGAWTAAAGRVVPMDDKVPLIVPPTSGKSGFFENETVRDQWVQAADSLREATNIYCIGYSIPPTDHLMRFMLAANCAGKVVHVINRGEDVLSHYQRALPASDVRGDHISNDPVPGFVAGYDGVDWEPPVNQATE